MTAHHCLDRDKNEVLSDFEKTLAGSIDFAFNYKKPTCSNNFIVSYVNYNYSGAYFRAGDWETDFLLLELKEAVTDPNIRFLGWDAEPYPFPEMSSGFGIHHPGGDLMKVSQDPEDIWLADWWIPWNETPSWSPLYSHFFVSWDAGATEGGSSGSPLFDQNHRVRGQLHGGNGECPNNSFWEDIVGLFNYAFYGALAKSMNVGAASHQGLYNWLVPYSTGSWGVDFICNTTGACQSITFENKSLTKDERIVCKNIILQNVTINSSATLLLQATEQPRAVFHGKCFLHLF